jgi:hypothetical protein
MYVKDITFTDYDGVERTERAYFNLSQAEIAEYAYSVEGGLYNYVNRLITRKDIPKLMEMFKEIIIKSYGEKSADGRRFIKSPELVKEFMETEAYSNLFMELATQPNAVTEFLNGIMPVKLSKEEIDKATKDISTPQY